MPTFLHVKGHVLMMHYCLYHYRWNMKYITFNVNYYKYMTLFIPLLPLIDSCLFTRMITRLFFIDKWTINLHYRCMKKIMYLKWSFFDLSLILSEIDWKFLTCWLVTYVSIICWFYIEGIEYSTFKFRYRYIKKNSMLV